MVVLTSWNTLGLSRPVLGLLYLLPYDSLFVHTAVIVMALNAAHFIQFFILFRQLFIVRANTFHAFHIYYILSSNSLNCRKGNKVPECYF